MFKKFFKKYFKFEIFGQFFNPSATPPVSFISLGLQKKLIFLKEVKDSCATPIDPSAHFFWKKLLSSKIDMSKNFKNTRYPDGYEILDYKFVILDSFLIPVPRLLFLRSTLFLKNLSANKDT